jgi:hypothetical protein
MSKARITKTTQEWNTINWAKVQRKVFKLQTKIFQAVKSGNKVKAKKLQKTPVKVTLCKAHSRTQSNSRQPRQENGWY